MASSRHRHQLSLEAVLDFSKGKLLGDDSIPAAEQVRAESTFYHILSCFQDLRSSARVTIKGKRTYNHGEVLRLMYEYATNSGRGKILRYFLAAMTSLARGCSEAQYEITFGRIVDELFDFQQWEEARKRESMTWICDIADVLVDGFLLPRKSHAYHKFERLLIVDE